MRSALIYWGQNPAPDVARVEVDAMHRRHVVTWADVMRERRERQRQRLEYKRQVAEWRAYKLWVAYFDQPLMGGWHAFLETYRTGFDQRIWIDRDREWMRPKVMELFPLVAPCSEPMQWRRWKTAFAEAYERRRQDDQPLGVAYIWWNGRDDPRRICGAVKKP